MDCRLVIDLDRNRLMRVVVLLLSMAMICERAATRSLRVRLRVFWLLDQAESVALTLFDVPDDTAGPPPGALLRVDGFDLVLLAARLRAIALLLAHACPLDGIKKVDAPQDVVPRLLDGPLPVAPIIRALPFHDTS